MSIKITVEGEQRLQRKFAAYPEAVKAAIEKAQLANALQAEAIAKKSVQSGSRSGRLYKRRGIVHRASAPGQPPKSDTGFLVSHLRGFVKDRFIMILQAATRYAIFLEFGTRKMGARPFMERAVLTMLKQDGLKRLRDAINTAGRDTARRR